MESLKDISTPVSTLQMHTARNSGRQRRMAIVNPDNPRAVVPGGVPRGVPEDTTIHRQLPPPPPLTVAPHGTHASIESVVP